MKESPHLLVAIHDRSWGRGEMAVRVAADLIASRQQAHLLVHESIEPLVRDSGLSYEVVPDHIRGLVRLLLDKCVQRCNPKSVIYFDFFNTANYLLQAGVPDSSFLTDYDCPIMSLDTWHYRLTGDVVDVFGKVDRSLAFGSVSERKQQFETIGRLVPVPVASSDREEGKFACLPKRSGLAPRESWRRQVGIPDSHSLLLFCTSRWQHPSALGEAGRRMAHLVPQLVAEQVRRLGSTAHLVHVGPEPYPLEELLQDRYHWIAPTSRLEFERIMQSADVLISGNVSATSIGWAIAYEVPVLVLKNSHSIPDARTARAILGSEVVEPMSAKLEQALPTYPFLLWPLGYHRFLGPLLHGNDFCQTFKTVEVLETDAVVEECHQLLADTDAREQMAGNQRRYAQRVQQLPSAVQAIGQFM